MIEAAGQKIITLFFSFSDENPRFSCMVLHTIPWFLEMSLFYLTVKIPPSLSGQWNRDDTAEGKALVESSNIFAVRLYNQLSSNISRRLHLPVA